MGISTELKQLNTEQQKAVKHTNGPLLIIAGAGTGKTSVITTKIAWLIEQKLAEPNEILALTFTDKAAEEMEERVDMLVPYGVFDMWISTFHSFCDKMLQNHALDIGLNPDYRILNTTESWLLLQKHLYTLNLDYYRPKGNPTRFIHALIKLFSRLKDENITPEEYLKFAEGMVANNDATMGDEGGKLETKRVKETADAYFQYQQLLLDNNYVDFGDLIFYANKLFVQRPNILQTYQKQFKFILVDEFQDTNLAQYNLVKLLAGKAENITVVGDDDQSIYKFRGASVSNILNFKKDFPKSEEVVLTKNYRSTQDILDLSYTFIQNNNPDRLEYQLNNPDEYYKKQGKVIKHPISKKLTSAEKESGTIERIHAATQEEEVTKVIDKIQELIKSGSSPNDIAILVRANRHAEGFILALEALNIPYIYLASSGLYSEPLIGDILAWMRVLYDSADSISLSRILMIPTIAIPPKELLAINLFTKRKAHTLETTLQNIRSVRDLSEDTIKKIETVMNRIERERKNIIEKTSREMLFTILEDTKYREYLIALEKKNQQKGLHNIRVLNQFAKKIENHAKIYDDNSLKSFIENVDLEREAGDRGTLEQDIESQGPEAIKILTVHASKGLEFPYVFITNMVEGRFPSINRRDDIEMPRELIEKKEILPESKDTHIQEERRLFYVAATRAKKGLYITGADFYGGKRGKKPSRFLVESKLVKEEDIVPLKKEDIAILEEHAKAQSKPEEKHEYPIPHEFSFSQISTFKKCPLQYKYQYVLKIPIDKGKSHFSFGSTMHNTLYELLKRTSAGESSQESLFGSTPEGKKAAITLDDIYKIYDEKWIDDWYESAESKKHYYRAGKKILKEFYERHKDNWPNPLYLEKDFKIQLGENTLKGRIDRIDKIGDNEVEIIDYKTGKYKEKLYKDDKMQLLIYQIALEQGNIQPTKLKYYYLDEKNQNETEFVAKDKDIEKTKKELRDTMEEIKKSDFPANPSTFNCTHCDFKNICPMSAV